jgi:hyperosmotically inducible protein
MRRIAQLLVGAAVGLCLVAGQARAQPGAGTEVPGAEQAKVEKQIQANLQNDAELRDNKIDVRVDGRVATLTGTVDSAREKTRAAKLSRVGPIDLVDNQLEVASAGIKNAVTDSGITTEIKTQFLANTTLRHANISVDTNNGVVTLKGTVPSLDVRRLAIDLARHTGGVKRVDDDMLLSPR